jgi:hypothetical protein
MKTMFWGFAALLASPALFGVATSANAATVPDASFEGGICAGTSSVCNGQLGFPANTQVSYSSSSGTASLTASYGLAPSPSLFVTGTASGDGIATDTIIYRYFIELTGPTGPVQLTVNTTGSAIGGASTSASVGLTETGPTPSSAYFVSTSGGVVSVALDGGGNVNSSGTSFNRSDVVTITEDVVYQVALSVVVFADSTNPQGTSSVDPYFQFPVGYSLDISSGVGNSPLSATPLPAALPLFAGGLGAMGLFGWRRKRKTAAIAS